MAHDVFISHSSKDKTVADSVCSTLESRGIRCWVAPRDILPGSNWGESIIDAIAGSKVMVLVLSSHSNISDQVAREIERAANKGVAILPLRIEDTPLSKSLEYFLSTAHWLDACSKPSRDDLDRLADSVEQLTSANPSPNGLATLAPDVTSSPHPGRKRSIGAKAQLVLLALFLAIGIFFVFRGGAEKQAQQVGTGTSARGSNASRPGESSPGTDRVDTSKTDHSVRSDATKLLGLNSPRMTVEHFRVDPGGTPVRLGRIGAGERQSIQMNDAIRLSLEMDQRQHVLLVAFNPDGGVQLCFPDDETTAPAAIQRLEFPSERDLYFRLTDGRGQQAFLVFVSDQPLPAFATFRKNISTAGWAANTTGGLWRFDGSKVSQIFSDRKDRGAVQRLTTPHFRSLCTSLVEQPSAGQVMGLAFPVE